MSEVTGDVRYAATARGAMRWIEPTTYVGHAPSRLDGCRVSRRQSQRRLGVSTHAVVYISTTAIGSTGGTFTPRRELSIISRYLHTPA